MKTAAAVLLTILASVSQLTAQPSFERWFGGGGTRSFGAGDYDAWLVKTNAKGDSSWTRTFGGSQTEYGVTVEQTPDGGFVVGGYTTTYGAGSYDFYIIKTDPDGNVAVAEPGPGYTRRPAAATVVRRAGLPAETERPGVKLFGAMGRQVRAPVRAAPGVYVRVLVTETGIETARLVLTE